MRLIQDVPNSITDLDTSIYVRNAGMIEELSTAGILDSHDPRLVATVVLDTSNLKGFTDIQPFGDRNTSSVRLSAVAGSALAGLLPSLHPKPDMVRPTLDRASLA